MTSKLVGVVDGVQHDLGELMRYRVEIEHRGLENREVLLAQRRSRLQQSVVHTAADSRLHHVLKLAEHFVIGVDQTLDPIPQPAP